MFNVGNNRVNVKLDEYLNNRAAGIASFNFVALMAGSSTSQIYYGIMEERYPTIAYMFFRRRQAAKISLPEDVWVAPKLLPASDAPRME
jgi:hypothetical protein